jgi:hypothetical protein
MSLLVAGVMLVAAAIVAIAVLVLVRRGRTAEVLVACDPDSALLGSAIALRRLGARITRYDSEDGTLEATIAGGDGHVRVRAAPNGDDATLLQLEGNPSARGVVRRFRGTLSV